MSRKMNNSLVFAQFDCFLVLVAPFHVVNFLRKPFIDYRTRAIITRGLYTFYPLFEVHLSTVTFGL